MNRNLIIRKVIHHIAVRDRWRYPIMISKPLMSSMKKKVRMCMQRGLPKLPSCLPHKSVSVDDKMSLYSELNFLNCFTILYTYIYTYILTFKTLFESCTDNSTRVVKWHLHFKILKIKLVVGKLRFTCQFGLKFGLKYRS